MPLVFSLHNPPPLGNTLDYHRFDKFMNCNYIAHSQSQKSGYNRLGITNIDVVHHGVQMCDFPFNDSSDSFLLCIGRFIPDKGVSMALRVAAKLLLPIKIATGVGSKTDHYHQEIRPYLRSELVQQLPFLQGEEKSKTLKEARLFLFPIQWEEPFGMVLIESMATGTPVVAFARGSVPEIIKDGETGLLVNPSDNDIRGDWTIKKQVWKGCAKQLKKYIPCHKKGIKRCDEHAEPMLKESLLSHGWQQATRRSMRKF